MASNHSQGGNDGRGSADASRRPPEWADGLKQLYDSVVEEALPDAFRDLLDRLDDIDPQGAAAGASHEDASQGRGGSTQ